MPIIRSESQGGGNVLEHYVDSEDHSLSVREMSAAMRRLIPALDAKLPNTEVWGLTSHHSLSLMSVAEYDAGETHVAIERFAGDCFHMSYNPPDGRLPVPDSPIGFIAIGVEEAVERILIAMSASGGWPASIDLPR